MVLLALITTALASPPEDFDALEKEVRDGLVSADDARARLGTLVPALDAWAAAQGCPASPRSTWVFPVEGYDRKAIGGTHGEGYQPGGYDWFDGNRHGGHPAQDIFVRDTNQDSLDDTTGAPVRILSLTGGVVVATAPAWDPAGGIRGGIYAYIWDPPTQALVYYAHLGRLDVRPGDCVEPGFPIGNLGRTGKNASAARSPAHLHLSYLPVQDGAPVPADLYADLLALKGRVAPPGYGWLDGAPVDTIEKRFSPPDGFTRDTAEPDSFAAWLRGLPLKPPGSPVRLYDGRLKGRQDVHAAVVDIDVGKRDLQQCADAVMRLRSEYLWASGHADDIAFHFTSGDLASWSRWRAGWRPVVAGSKVTWTKRAASDASRDTYHGYLDIVFNYAGTASLEKELRRDTRVDPGDVFFRGGFPGHAVIVLDVAVAPDGQRAFLLGQSYMPAQEIHVLKNPRDPAMSPWYVAPFSGSLVTPEWVFEAGELRAWGG